MCPWWWWWCIPLQWIPRIASSAPQPQPQPPPPQPLASCSYHIWYYYCNHVTALLTTANDHPSSLHKVTWSSYRIYQKHLLQQKVMVDDGLIKLASIMMACVYCCALFTCHLVMIVVVVNTFSHTSRCCCCWKSQAFITIGIFLIKSHSSFPCSPLFHCFPTWMLVLYHHPLPYPKRWHEDVCYYYSW